MNSIDCLLRYAAFIARVKILKKESNKMIITKRLLVQFFLILEIVFLVKVYVFGNQGILYLMDKNNQNKKLASLIQHKKETLINLEQEIEAWQTIPFYKEEWAREKLQMARSCEQVYVIAE